MKNLNYLQKYIFRIMLISTLTGFVIVGCASMQRFIAETLPTPIDYTPSTFTPTVCPTIYLSTPEASLYPPVFIMYLVEENSGDESGWKYASESYSFIKNVMFSASEPGDRTTIFRLGSLKFQDALLLDQQIGSASQPDIPETLTPWPTSTPLPTLVNLTVEPVYSMMTATKAAATQISIDATATKISILNNCGEQIWISEYAVVATQWEDTRLSSKLDFDNNLDDKISTPYILSETESTSSVFEGLQFATLAFGKECDGIKYRRCILVVFSDLSEYRLSPPDYFNPPINLENVEVISVMLNCAVQYVPECLDTQDIWSKTFISLKAKSIDYFNGNDLEENLINFIRR